MGGPPTLEVLLLLLLLPSLLLDEALPDCACTAAIRLCMNAAKSCATPVPEVESVLSLLELPEVLVEEVPEVLAELVELVLEESLEPVRPRLDSACRTAPIMPPPGGGPGGGPPSWPSI